MPDSVWNISFVISVVFSLSGSILIGTKLYKTGVEYFSSRLLILTGIINTCLCILLLLLQCFIQIYTIVVSAVFSPIQIIFIFFSIAVPIRILWNYFAIQRNIISQYCLTTYNSQPLKDTITSLSKALNIPLPKIMSSPAISTPFVFGHRSKNAVLAIPQNLEPMDINRQKTIILHELAHIRNRDVGFLAWSNACVKDIARLLIALPMLIILAEIGNGGPIIPSLVIYIICLALLYSLLKYIIRQRESLADLTAALLVESGTVKMTISESRIDIAENPEHAMETGAAKPPRMDQIQRWLTDKALFSAKPTPWRMLLDLFNFFYSQHPDQIDRLKMITSAQNRWVNARSPSLGNSFWAGMTFGLLGVMLGLGGYWFSAFTRNPKDSTEILQLPFKLYGLAAPLVLSFWSLFLVLPDWSSFCNPSLGAKFLLSQLKSHSIGLVGACLMCPVLLTAGVFDDNIHVLVAICAMWNLFIVCFGFVISIVSIYLWIKIRYLQSSQLSNLKKGFWMLAPLVVVFFSFEIISMGLILKGRVFQGTNLFFSSFTGVVFILLSIGYSRFSEKDMFFILHFFRLIYLVEGKGLKWRSRMMDVVGCPVLLIGFGLPVYLTINLILAEPLKNIGARAGLLFLIISSCAILFIIQPRDIRQIRESKRTKVYHLFHCLQLLSKTLDAQLDKNMRCIVAAYSFTNYSCFQKKSHLTVNDAFEYIHLISNDNSQKELIPPLLSWILSCQQSKGFGLWPGSSPRLSSTYYAISILNENDVVGQCNTREHISWIQAFQQPDGFFKGPWSRRDAWEDTFFATRSLSILASPLSPNKAEHCRKWTQSVLITEGIKKNRADIVYYCFGILDALNKLDNETLNVILDWLPSKIEELLVANFALNYESVHFTMMIYQILCSHRKHLIDNKSITLFAERSYAALKAELADIST